MQITITWSILGGGKELISIPENHLQPRCQINWPVRVLGHFMQNKLATTSSEVVGIDFAIETHQDLTSLAMNEQSFAYFWITSQSSNVA